MNRTEDMSDEELEECSKIIFEIQQMLVGKKIYISFNILSFIISNIIANNVDSDEKLSIAVLSFIKTFEKCINGLLSKKGEIKVEVNTIH